MVGARAPICSKTALLPLPPEPLANVSMYKVLYYLRLLASLRPFSATRRHRRPQRAVVAIAACRWEPPGDQGDLGGDGVTSPRLFQPTERIGHVVTEARDVRCPHWFEDPFS